MTQSVAKLQAPFERLKGESTCPEVALARAIILQAIIDASSVSNEKVANKMQKDAYNWIFCDNEDFFDICCDAEFEPEYVRKVTSEFLSFHIKHVNKVTYKQFGVI